MTFIRKTGTAFAALAALSLSVGGAAADDEIVIKWKGAPEISSADGKFKFKIRGRIMADYIYQDGDVAGYDYSDGTELRRARLGAEGQYGGFFKYKFEVDFAGDKADITDAYVQFKTKPAAITIGQQKHPTSLEEQTSSRYITFMERAAITDAFGFDRRIGASANFAGDNYTFKVGAYGQSAGDSSTKEGHLYGARGTFAPIAEKDRAIHLGASVFYRENADGDLTIRYRQRPQVHVSKRFVSTGSIAAEKDMFWGVEAAGVFGPFSVQSEYGQITAEAIGGGSDPKFNGGYVDASWFLTGEHRTYKANKGSFGRVKVQNPVGEGGHGAVQVAVRYDFLDLEDGAIMGGQQDSILFGVNWHLNNYVRAMVNYVYTDVSNSFAATESAPDDKINSLGVRFQVDW